MMAEATGSRLTCKTEAVEFPFQVPPSPSIALHVNRVAATWLVELEGCPACQSVTSAL